MLKMSGGPSLWTELGQVSCISVATFTSKKVRMAISLQFLGIMETSWRRAIDNHGNSGVFLYYDIVCLLCILA